MLVAALRITAGAVCPLPSTCDAVQVAIDRSPLCCQLFMMILQLQSKAVKLLPRGCFYFLNDNTALVKFASTFCKVNTTDIELWLDVSGSFHYIKL